MRARAAVLFLCVSAAPVLADASFDCRKASTPVEKTICADDNPGLAERDGALGRLYAALKEEGGHDEVLAGQSAWLAARDACGTDAECIRQSYDKRLAQLAREAGDSKGVTGTYRYQLTGEEATADSDFGEAFVVRGADGTLAGTIFSVSGPTYHTCDISFDGAEAGGKGRWQWQGAPDEVEVEGERCKITFDASPGQMAISSENCRYFCGARGWFDETYAKVK